MAEDVKPTRAEELRLKEQIELAESGHSILEKKRDSLIHEFMDLVGEAKDTKGEVADRFSIARKRMKEAKAVEGADRLRSVAMATEQEPDIELESRNIMGVKVPRIESEEVELDLGERGFGLLSGSAALDEVIQAYEDLISAVIEAAEIETALMKLLDEIDSTKRRVNALENRVIPERKDQLDYVSQYLEENEREETFRLKKIKEKGE
ncbi:MAG: V-type ATP synthase subunit D [Candidatus Nanohaloarchaeota archaeon QJJ-7]|nr:V-type ATP synthase subunit D [Candidatus Nanohaloarchaeota archaeon QJJ-7]